MQPLPLTLFTLSHVLVFVYWLGGDLGAFYATSFVVDEKRSVPERLLAAKILGDIDMAPRISLLLALPTGLAVAATKGWLPLGWPVIGLTFILAILWIGLAFYLHHHPAADALKKLDLSLRTLLLAGLLGAAGCGLTGLVALPFFISLKCLCLAFAILMGLLIRRYLAAFGPAFRTLATTGPDAETNHIIRTTLKTAKPMVMLIWLAIITAAFLGIAIPQ